MEGEGERAATDPEGVDNANEPPRVSVAVVVVAVAGDSDDDGIVVDGDGDVNGDGGGGGCAAVGDVDDSLHTLVLNLCTSITSTEDVMYLTSPISTSSSPFQSPAHTPSLCRERNE